MQMDIESALSSRQWIEKNDLAVLSVVGAHEFSVGLRLAEVQAPVGTEVFALGFPHPDIMGESVKLTAGSIASLTGLHDDPRTYQFSAAVSPGVSGAPLVDMEGRVVGIVTSKLNAVAVFGWTGDLPENVSYAVKGGYVGPLLGTAGSAKAVAGYRYGRDGCSEFG